MQVNLVHIARCDGLRVRDRALRLLELGVRLVDEGRDSRLGQHEIALGSCTITSGSHLTVPKAAAAWSFSGALTVNEEHISVRCVQAIRLYYHQARFISRRAPPQVRSRVNSPEPASSAALYASPAAVASV